MTKLMLRAFDDQTLTHTADLDDAAHGRHIFNLGHGMTPDVHPESMALMIDMVRAG
jgi:uroporphyrinogen-III decarboxylase